MARENMKQIRADNDYCEQSGTFVPPFITTTEIPAPATIYTSAVGSTMGLQNSTVEDG